MKEQVVRLQSIEIKNIKNVNKGKVDMPKALNKELNYNSAEVLGIYGQNGSGKTAIIDALQFIWRLMTGRNITTRFYDYIDVNSSTAEIKTKYAVFFLDVKYEVTHDICFRRTEDRKVVITKESLSAAEINATERKNNATFICYTRDSKAVFTPKRRYDELIKLNEENAINLIVAKRMSEKSNCSYIFSDNSREILIPHDSEENEKNGKRIWPYSRIINALYIFAVRDLFVIPSSHTGVISANIALPMAFRLDDIGKKSGIKGNFYVSLREPTLLDEEQVLVLHRIVEDINIVLPTIIPGLRIEDRDLGKQTTEDGEEGYKTELLSVREGMKPFPIRMESEGIIKIISMLNALIQAFGNPSICLVIDELDAGIFEYMLGELLDIFNKSAKGQLIFTSHNLRALEMLSKDSIIFSTANPNKRYIRIKNVKKTNNLRDVYIRTITLGGCSEKLYAETDSLKIARAFRKAGRRNRIGNE